VPKGPPPQWRKRDCRFDHLIAAALAQGHGKTLVYTGIETEERAHDIRRGIYRCAKHRGVSADAGRSVLASGGDMGVHKQADGKYTLKFRVFTKAEARKRHIERYGTNRQDWPYNPRRGASPEERDSWANRDEKGKIVR
jgi:hypothetical protein